MVYKKTKGPYTVSLRVIQRNATRLLHYRIMHINIGWSNNKICIKVLNVLKIDLWDTQEINIKFTNISNYQSKITRTEWVPKKPEWYLCRNYF